MLVYLGVAKSSFLSALGHRFNSSTATESPINCSVMVRESTSRRSLLHSEKLHAVCKKDLCGPTKNLTRMRIIGKDGKPYSFTEESFSGLDESYVAPPKIRWRGLTR